MEKVELYLSEEHILKLEKFRERMIELTADSPSDVKDFEEMELDMLIGVFIRCYDLTNKKPTDVGASIGKL